MGDEAEHLSSHFDGFEGDSELFNYGDRVFSNRTGNAKIVGCVEREDIQRYGLVHWLSDYRHPFDPNDFEDPIYIVRYSQGTGRKRGSREKLIHPDELTLISPSKKSTPLTNKTKMEPGYKFNCNIKAGKVVVELSMKYETEDVEELNQIARNFHSIADYMTGIANNWQKGGAEQ